MNHCTVTSLLFFAMGAHAFGQTNEPVARAANECGLALFRRAAEDSRGKSVVVSPASASIGLTAALLGAGGRTRDEMRHVLSLDDVPFEKTASEYEALLHSLARRDPKVTLVIANAIWHSPEFPIRRSFVDLLQSSFHSEILPIGGTSSEAWVAKKTDGMIPHFARPEVLGPDALEILNVVSFKGAWTRAFDGAKTTSAPFHRADGATVSCPLMHATGGFAYFEDDHVQVVDLPFGRGAIQFTLVLPKPTVPIDALVAELRADRLDQWLRAEHGAPGDIFLPRFECKGQRNLVGDLKALGMTSAFDPRTADFSGVFEGKSLPITDVDQATFFAVDEAGVEAAAATRVLWSIGYASANASSFTLRADRPFLFTLRDDASGLLFFVGTVGDPTVGN
ncbi:MAG: serpin family protein [Planctomycetes bacterium]|nr:serpin family protein [Planctomycetota bacterium]MBI3845657.1 serpin family protein [Planctomycetota bacterium]